MQVRALLRRVGLGGLEELNRHGHSAVHLGIELLRLGEVDVVPQLLVAIRRLPGWMLDRPPCVITLGLFFVVCSVACLFNSRLQMLSRWCLDGILLSIVCFGFGFDGFTLECLGFPDICYVYIYI